LSDQRSERALEFVAAPNLYGLDGYVQVPAGALDYLLGSHGTRRYRIPQEGHARNPWDGLLQKLQILADDVGGGIVGQSGDVSPRPCKARDELRAPTGSLETAMTTGIVAVACFTER
jgi:hypothetical protein